MLSNDNFLNTYFAKPSKVVWKRFIYDEPKTVRQKPAGMSIFASITYELGTLKHEPYVKRMFDEKTETKPIG